MLGDSFVPPMGGAYWRYLPMAAYTAINPIAGAGSTYVYSATVEGILYLISWTQSWIVPGGVNNAANQWQIEIGVDTIPNVATSLGSVMSTFGSPGAQWGQWTNTGFNFNPIDPATYRNIWIRVNKVGAPSAIYVSSPMIRVLIS